MSDSTPKTGRAALRLPDLDTVYTINADGSRNFVHLADVKGRFQRRKDLIFAGLIVFYLALPWIRIKGFPAVHIDIPGRAAYLFGQTFTNQDFYLMFFVLTGIGFALFVATSLFGRVWCGYACPQTVFLEGVFRKLERWIEGPRTTRLRRNQGILTFDKFWRKALKQTIFLGLAFFLAHAFVAYFIPARQLVHVIFQDPSEHWSAFVWTMAWTAVLYFDYAWFREQTCLIICPYGRLQSALIDRDTIIVGYDRKRGEPRSKVSDTGGDCVDCRRCIAVCPTGIDIRNGLQLECVGCANCIDACDEIMEKIDRPRGLIRYDSARGLETGQRRSLLRPRAFLYGALGLVGLTVATVAASRREPFEVKVLRARGMPYTLEEGRLRNLYTIRVENKEAREAVFFIQAGTKEDDDDDKRPDFILSQPRVVVPPLGDVQVPAFAYLDRDEYEETIPIVFTVVDSTTGRRRTADARFLGP